MSTSKAHDMIVALLTRRLVECGYEIAALESSFKWLFGRGFRPPPAIARHRPDVLGVRDVPPHIAIGDAKTPPDLLTRRTKEQLLDYANAKTIGPADGDCYIVIGIPKSGAPKLRDLIRQLRVDSGRIEVLEVPDLLLADHDQ